VTVTDGMHSNVCRWYAKSEYEYDLNNGTRNYDGEPAPHLLTEYTAAWNPDGVKFWSRFLPDHIERKQMNEANGTFE